MLTGVDTAHRRSEWALPIETLVRLAQFMNANAPMLVTLLGIVMLVSPSHQKKALTSMLVTARPLIALGMITAPPGPVYPVIVTVPSLVV
jgi:hypothetical protein